MPFSNYDYHGGMINVFISQNRFFTKIKKLNKVLLELNCTNFFVNLIKEGRNEKVNLCCISS